jgi:hypothetical protein
MVWLLDCRLLSRDAYLFDVWVDRFHRVKPGCWAWLWPRKSFMAARKRVFLDLGRTVVEVKEFREVLKGLPSRDGLAPGFYVYGEEISRDQFLRRARLRPVDHVERETTVSLIAEWRVLSRPHDRTPDLNKEVLRRREFRSVEAFRRWQDKVERKDLALLQWRGDGELAELELEARMAGRQPPVMVTV